MSTLLLFLFKNKFENQLTSLPMPSPSESETDKGYNYIFNPKLFGSSKNGLSGSRELFSRIN